MKSRLVHHIEILQETNIYSEQSNISYGLASADGWKYLNVGILITQPAVMAM